MPSGARPTSGWPICAARSSTRPCPRPVAERPAADERAPDGSVADHPTADRPAVVPQGSDPPGASPYVLPERVEAGPLVIRAYEDGDARTLVAAVTANLEHLRPWM